MIKKNLDLFDELRALNLPMNQYVIVASGPLGIRNLREMSDIDILVTDELWSSLKREHTELYDHMAHKLRISANIEAFHEGSFEGVILGSPTVPEQIHESELIEGLPFQNIETALYFKKRGDREKDIQDAELIEEWIKENS